MKIENAKWHTDLEGNNIAILCTKDGQPMVHIPIDENNRRAFCINRNISAVLRKRNR